MNETLYEIIALISENVLLPLTVSFVTIYLTVRSERKKMVNEIRRTVYMSTLRSIHKLTKNPTLIFDDKYMDDLQQVALEVEVYGQRVVQDKFSEFFTDVQLRYQEYITKFKYDDERSQYEGDPIFGEMFEREEFDYTVEHMPQHEDVSKLAESLKQAIAVCLRKG